MNSKILPHSLIVFPRSPSQCLPPQKLGFSIANTRGSPFPASRISVARVPSFSFGSNIDAVVTAFARQRFVARAESESGGGETEKETENIVVEEEKSEEEAVSEGEEVKSEDEQVVKEPRKPRVKLGDIMGILNNRAVEATDKERPIADIRTGDIVEIKWQSSKNRRRLAIHKGIVMSRQNAGIHTTIRVRRIIAGIGVEIVFPLYSPNLKEIKVVKHRKVRRARLYYLRDKLPRFSTFK